MLAHKCSVDVLVIVVSGNRDRNSSEPHCHLFWNTISPQTIPFLTMALSAFHSDLIAGPLLCWALQLVWTSPHGLPQLENCGAFLGCALNDHVPPFPCPLLSPQSPRQASLSLCSFLLCPGLNTCHLFLFIVRESGGYHEPCPFNFLQPTSEGSDSQTHCFRTSRRFCFVCFFFFLFQCLIYPLHMEIFSRPSLLILSHSLPFALSIHTLVSGT